MDSTVTALTVFLVIVFFVGIGLGIVLERRCRRSRLLKSAQRGELLALQNVEVIAPPPAELVTAEQLTGKKSTRGIGIQARAISSDKVVEPRLLAVEPKRAVSVEVGEIYRTASALSLFLDDMETRPQLNRLISMPSLNNPQDLLKAKHFNNSFEVHMDEIDLQEQVGKGGFGAVYKGTWRGAIVAVKHAICNVEDAESLEQSIREVVLSKKLSHPNVVQTYAWTVLTGADAAGVAAIRDEAEVVKAALAQTNIVVSAPTRQLADMDPTLNSPKGTEVLPRIRTNGVEDSLHKAGDSQLCSSSMPEIPMKSPFANFIPSTALQSHEIGGLSSPRAQGPVEHISPLFERLILEAEASGGHGTEQETTGKVDMDTTAFGDSPCRSEGEALEVPGSLDRKDLLFCHKSDKPLGQKQTADTRDAENVPHAQNIKRPNQHLQIKVPEGSSPLQKVVSMAFSDVSGCMLSPIGEHLKTPASHAGHAGICPAPSRSHLPRTSSLSSKCPQTPSHLIRIKTPDSFNRHAPPGTSLFDGTEATPQQPARATNRGDVLPSRARRRIAFGASHSVDIRTDPGANQRSLSHRGTRRASDSGSPAKPPPACRRRSRSLSPRAAQRKGYEVQSTPICSSFDHEISRDSPADTDALLPRYKSPETPPQGIAAGRGGSISRVSCEGDLLVAGRAASVCSCASFNSEEGFGSPTVKRPKRKLTQDTDDVDGKGFASMTETEAMMVIVMEFCDLQSLQRAINKKVFKPHGRFSDQATYRALLRTAQEVAKGMDYIHGFGIVHGDLKPGNVLLKTHRIDRRGYIAKVSDFGLSRLANASGSKATGGTRLGTIAYTAPESFQNGVADMASDVYAFSILAWEMYHCREAYEGLMEGQICVGVADGSLRPEFDALCPKSFRRLLVRCWAQKPEARPKFRDIVKELTDIEASYRRECHLQKPQAARRRAPVPLSPSAPTLGRRPPPHTSTTVDRFISLVQ